MIGSPDLAEVVGRLPVPTHVLWGDEDRLLRAEAVETLREIFPRATATILRGVGHVPMLECPKRAARDYLAFRAGLTGAPSAEAA